MIISIPKKYWGRITFGPGCVKAAPGVVLTPEEKEYVKELEKTLKEEGR